MGKLDDLITPIDIKSYTDYEDVLNRDDNKLLIDIKRAVTYVQTYTNNDFLQYEIIPDNVKTALILLSEYYAYSAINKSNGFKSETLDNYSYTKETSSISINDIDLNTLLDDFVLEKSKNSLNMKLRGL